MVKGAVVLYDFCQYLDSKGDSTFSDSEMYFDEWYSWAIRSQLNPMIKIAKSLKKHKDGILRWFETKMTNGLLEGLNSLVQTIVLRITFLP